MEIKIIENVLKLNDEVAQQNRHQLREAGVTCINLIGSPGSGKTALLERTLEMLGSDLAVGVLAGDMATTRDANRLAAFTPHVVQINVGKSCHLDANQVRQGMNSLDLTALDLLIIENVGNLICPVGFDLGQDVKVGMFSATEGDDKPAKHPYLVLEAGLLLLNKIDLLPHVPFDVTRFREDVGSIREGIPLIELSAVTGDGLDVWCTWLRRLCNERPSTDKQPCCEPGAVL
ncbi:MAG: hydrogenase accessory protein HypB [Planctomycetes bacterium]|nr:hydrogenase accessory protein HypB [Planctomycetota bacterium]NOG53774.1 hydrogenase nickel incorporation protein HypB [Planctomycetota bacterium]